MRSSRALAYRRSRCNSRTDRSYHARQLVTSACKRARLAAARTTPKLVPITTGLGEVFYYSVDYSSVAAHAPATAGSTANGVVANPGIHHQPQLRTAGVAEVNATMAVT